MRLTTYISFCILSKTTRFSPNKMSTEQKNEVSAAKMHFC